MQFTLQEMFSMKSRNITTELVALVTVVIVAAIWLTLPGESITGRLALGVVFAAVLTAVTLVRFFTILYGPPLMVTVDKEQADSVSRQ